MASKSKKERVIHTRVPEQLDSQLKDKAQGLGISVSKLIRHVLSNTFELVDDIVTDSAELARASHKALQQAVTEPTDTQKAPDEEPGPVVLAWQPVVLNKNALCESCNSILPKGSRAHIGISHPPAQATPVMCNSCVEELANEPTSDSDPQ